MPAVFTHDDAALLGGREDVVTTVNAIEAEVSRSAVFISYGVTNQLDVSIAVPFVTADVVVTSDATIQRIGTTNPETHFFRSIEDDIGARRRFTAFGSASGLGDVTVRLKQTVKRGTRQGVALGIDLRLPTGEERNLLGTGAPGVSPFVAWSANYGALSPHLNAGYQWNGDSILGGEPGSGEARGPSRSGDVFRRRGDRGASARHGGGGPDRALSSSTRLVFASKIFTHSTTDRCSRTSRSRPDPSTRSAPLLD